MTPNCSTEPWYQHSLGRGKSFPGSPSPGQGSWCFPELFQFSWRSHQPSPSSLVIPGHRELRTLGIFLWRRASPSSWWPLWELQNHPWSEEQDFPSQENPFSRKTLFPQKTFFPENPLPFPGETRKTLFLGKSSSLSLDVALMISSLKSSPKAQTQQIPRPHSHAGFDVFQVDSVTSEFFSSLDDAGNSVLPTPAGSCRSLWDKG